MAYQFYPGRDHLSAAPGGATPGYGPTYYSRSAPSSPYQPAVLLPTPPGGATPLPGGQVWVPYGYSPNTQTIPLQPSPGRVIPQQPVLLDILNPGSSGTWRQTGNAHIYYDLRDDPNRALVNARPPALLSSGHLAASVTSSGTSSIKIISKAFPWEIDVESRDGVSPVTVEELIVAIHETLDKHITGPEWWIVTEDVRTKVSAQYGRNCDASSVGEGRHRGEVEKPRYKKDGLRRIDWLLDAFVMKGLEKDDAFIASRIRDRSIREQTWVLVTGPK